MHYAIEKFSNTREDNLVYEQVRDINAKMFNQDIDWDRCNAKHIILNEGDELKAATDHVPHINNLYKKATITKLVAFHILSSRDDIQGGEFQFKYWGQPHRKDNFGKQIKSSNPYPLWLNEQGTLFVVSALESVGTFNVVSGQLEVIKYQFIGDNYK